MSEQDIVRLIKEGSVDEFLDCLDFAPVGVIDLIKKFSVSIPLYDMQKRAALKKKTGFDVDAALWLCSLSVKGVVGHGNDVVG